MTNQIQFIDRTDFFATIFECENENRERRALYRQVCDKIAQHTEKSRDLMKDTVRYLANIFDELSGDIARSDFIDLWQDEDNAPIVFAQKVTTPTSGNSAFIIAFLGKGFTGEEVTIYEF